MFTKDAYFNAGRAPVPAGAGRGAEGVARHRGHRNAHARRLRRCSGSSWRTRSSAPLAFQFELVAMNKRVQGYKTNLLGKPKYDDVWLES